MSIYFTYILYKKTFLLIFNSFIKKNLNVAICIYSEKLNTKDIHACVIYFYKAYVPVIPKYVCPFWNPFAWFVEFLLIFLVAILRGAEYRGSNSSQRFNCSVNINNPQSIQVCIVWKWSTFLFFCWNSTISILFFLFNRNKNKF